MLGEERRGLTPLQRELCRGPRPHPDGRRGRLPEPRRGRAACSCTRSIAPGRLVATGRLRRPSMGRDVRIAVRLLVDDDRERRGRDLDPLAHLVVLEPLIGDSTARRRRPQRRPSAARRSPPGWGFSRRRTVPCRRRPKGRTSWPRRDRNGDGTSTAAYERADGQIAVIGRQRLLPVPVGEAMAEAHGRGEAGGARF